MALLTLNHSVIAGVMMAGASVSEGDSGFDSGVDSFAQFLIPEPMEVFKQAVRVSVGGGEKCRVCLVHNETSCHSAVCLLVLNLHATAIMKLVCFFGRLSARGPTLR